MNNNLITIDGDGVMVDYTTAYGRRWAQCFGTIPRVLDANAYWPRDVYSVEELEGERLEKFRHHGGDAFWQSFDALPGAVEACLKLSKAGFDLVCVTALTPQYGPARLANLRNLGFPIDKVYATGDDHDGRNPKQELINELKPAAFVDDYLHYMQGIDPAVHTALIEAGKNKSPNWDSKYQPPKGIYKNLLAFADWWVDRRQPR